MWFLGVGEKYPKLLNALNIFPQQKISDVFQPLIG